MPCIQTLGHLGQMLQWPKFGTLRDTAEVLLAESAETYAFIEKVSLNTSSLSGQITFLECFRVGSLTNASLSVVLDDQIDFWTFAIKTNSYWSGRSSRSERGTI